MMLFFRTGSLASWLVRISPRAEANMQASAEITTECELCESDGDLSFRPADQQTAANLYRYIVRSEAHFGSSHSDNLDVSG